ncbi:hypothetical protein K504DRAFT_467844 [Pleomassaria siparia CBS 279.74]|uniref:Uncharacterized protein n=1 Tax=Pleomassaria siparia CBS 279.74 TaxID=1314801 RepID=A0A6G1K6S5_9PLEO|nr:hypothetical protein K504DRAFT_467844 [Pleomassaria siparia CBS 279.74]
MGGRSVGAQERRRYASSWTCLRALSFSTACLARHARYEARKSKGIQYTRTTNTRLAMTIPTMRVEAIIIAGVDMMDTSRRAGMGMSAKTMDGRMDTVSVSVGDTSTACVDYALWATLSHS